MRWRTGGERPPGKQDAPVQRSRLALTTSAKLAVRSFVAPHRHRCPHRLRRSITVKDVNVRGAQAGGILFQARPEVEDRAERGRSRYPLRKCSAKFSSAKHHQDCTQPDVPGRCARRRFSNTGNEPGNDSKLQECEPRHRHRSALTLKRVQAGGHPRSSFLRAPTFRQCLHAGVFGAIALHPFSVYLFIQKTSAL